MKKRITLSVRNVFFFLFIVIITLFSCRKTVEEEVVTTDESAVARKQFFGKGNNTSENLLSLMDDLRRRDAVHNFVPELVHKYGLPKWSVALTNELTLTAVGRTKSSDTLIYFIPFLHPETAEVSAYLLCTKVDTFYNYVLYSKEQLIRKSSLANANPGFFKNAISLFSFFERTINKRDTLYVDGIINRLFTDVRVSFESQKSRLNGKQSRSGFYAYSIQTCYQISCSNYQGRISKTSATIICMNCFTTWYVDWGTYGGTTDVQNFWENPVGGGGGSGVGVNGFSSIVINLTYRLGLSYEQSLWLENNAQRALELYSYLHNSCHSRANSIALEHINRLMSDSDYLTFNLRYAATVSSSNLWWEDDRWLDNPENFNLDLDQDPNGQYDRLTAEEKVLVKKYPIHAFVISKNKDVAIQETISIFGVNGLNEKSDAFRHAFFNAINMRDLGRDPINL